MKQEKNKNGIIILLIVSNLILLTLLIVFATENIKLKSYHLEENYQNIPQTNPENNNYQENNNTPEKDNNQNEFEENEELENREDETINNSEDYLENDESFSGIVEVTGYPEIKELTDYIFDDSKKYQYVYFHITEVKNDKFEKYLESLKGNAFALDDAIGLGCLIDSKIQYYNDSDELGNKEFELSKKDTSNILKATKSNPIKLKLEKKLLTFGKGAPVCYSHMTKIEVK